MISAGDIGENNIKAVIFDLDDTLFPEIEYVQSGFEAVGQSISGGDEFLYKIYLKMLDELFNKSSLKVFDRFCGVYCDKQFQPLELLQTYRNHFPKIAFYSDVLPCFSWLKKRGIKIGILTDGRTETQQAKIDALRLNEYCDEIVITDSLGGESFRKPNPYSYNYLCRKFGIALNQAIYVGDNPQKDFVIGRYGMKTIRIIRESGMYKSQSYADNSREDYRISSFEEVKEIFLLCL